MARFRRGRGGWLEQLGEENHGDHRASALVVVVLYGLDGLDG